MSHSDYIEAMQADELAEGAMKQVEVDDHKLLVAHVGEQFFAADAHCPHLHANLTKGTLEGTVVTCPLHHSQFDLTDGHALQWTDWKGAAKSMAEFVRHPRPLRVYETEVRDGTVWVGPQKEPPAQE
jgi:3-phenylpropionate/trans-cinnamate dioxygenase ferredoxin subunit